MAAIYTTLPELLAAHAEPNPYTFGRTIYQSCRLSAPQTSYLVANHHDRTGELEIPYEASPVLAECEPCRGIVLRAGTETGEGWYETPAQTLRFPFNDKDLGETLDYLDFLIQEAIENATEAP
jgi:hypothetical protein